ncbi:MAG TPA: hypothetical protein VGF51_02630 [Acidimicrobiales bacterium]
MLSTHFRGADVGHLRRVMMLRSECASQDEGSDEREFKRADDLNDERRPCEGRGQGIREAEQPEVDADQESDDCRQHEPNAGHGCEHAAPSDECKGENGPGDALDKEEGADDGNSAVSVSPQVKMNRAREGNENSTEYETEVEDHPRRL